jgi:peptidoglycan-associated lipoprotein
MKIYRILLTTIIITGLLATKTYAQKNWAQDADNAFKTYQYYDAVGLYKKAYSKVKKNKAEKARIVFQVAECYKLTADNKQAETYYKKAIAARYTEPIVHLYYADMMKVNEKYDEALIEYNTYKELAPKDKRGADGVESCTLAQQWKDNPTRYEVDNVKQFNSKDMDFAATYYDKKYKQILFTSSRDGSVGKDLDLWTGQNFSDLWLTVQDKKGSWNTPGSVGENINTKYNEGAACLNAKFNELYFTRCAYEKKKVLGCQIYISKKKGVAWDIPEVVVLGADSFSYGHPSLSADELTLYFSSDKEGGYGGKDIWVVHRSKKTKPWDKPVNLGPTINTVNDEMYPFIREDGILYFSSNGLIGMGGLDIFKVEKEGDKWGKPENMKSPINSAGDDFAIIFEGKLEKGYLSSNRRGGKGSDDIYSFYKPPLIFTLAGSICNDSSKTTPKELIVGAIVTLVGSDGTVTVDTTNAKGLYEFTKTQFLPGTSYQISVTAKNYFGAKGKESTVGLERSKDFVHDFCLVPIPKAPIVLPEILYSFAQWDLQVQYQDSLNGLIKTMEENPNLVIELGSHTDSRGSDQYNDTLSYKRAKSVVDYLISKNIAGDRLVPFGYGKKAPRVLAKDISVSKYVRGADVVDLKPPITFPKGVTLTDEYIDQFKSDEKKFEAAHQLNRRTEFRILREDYFPMPIDTTNKNTPEIKLKLDTAKDKKDQNNLIQPIKIVTPQPFELPQNISVAMTDNNTLGIENKNIENESAYKQN